MDFNPYFNFTENQRLGIRFKAKSRSNLVKSNFVRSRLYRDMIRKSSIDEIVYLEKTSYPNDPKSQGSSLTGGIFNLDFSPDAKLLGAACERKSVFLFDPITRRMVSQVNNAHEDSVNCICFLDNRLFATCSDDTTVALWDARFLKTKLKSMRGHSNWVKNIEYSAKDNYLVTSGFDGAIFAWDINKFNHNDGNEEASNIFYTGGLMRMRLTPSSDKMVISTINGYLIIIHDLCLDTLATDLNGFKPNMYRLLQMSGNPLRQALNSTPLFHAKRNRVELVSDFAPGNVPDIVSSLQIHPQGWVAVSRNVSSDQSTEWCCVHDIQTYPVNPDDDQDVNNKRPDQQSPVIPRQDSRRHSGFMMLAELLQAGNPLLQNNPIIVPPQSPHPDEILQRPIPPLDRATSESQASTSRGSSSGIAVAEPNHPDEFQIRNRGNRVNEFMELLSRITNRSPSSNDDNEAPNNRQEEETMATAENPNANNDSSDNSDDDEQNQGFLVIPSDPTTGSRPRFFSFVTQRSPTRRRRLMETRRMALMENSSRSGSGENSTDIDPSAKIHHNIKRLSHFIQESNSDSGRGFIKEVSFSPDGLLLASPYDCGVRLLSFSENIDDLSTCAAPSLDDPPRELHVVGTIADCHKEVVLSTAFSPHNFLLVTGCRGGSLTWHQPTL